SGDKEIAKVASCNLPAYQLPIGKEVLAVDPRYYRPTEVDLLIGDATKATSKLGWKPKYSLEALVEEMIKSDLDAFNKQKLLMKHGFDPLNQFE
ncbi:MAG: GDP-mannose 4,6-dehydratase, partial [Chitinophagaceae bacterium]|nr:GDP-mannose 4,6-dehydratase [Chitinophagaceae bacterium]